MAVVYADLEEMGWLITEARHNLVLFGTNCESEAKEEGVHERIAKTYGAGDIIARRKLQQTTNYNKALASESPFLVKIRVV